jgi:ubiquinone biosynthesis protein UbiJ
VSGDSSPTPLPGNIGAKLLNHLLTREAWATERLKPHAGEHFRIEAGPLALALGIDSEGLLVGDAPVTEPAVVIRLDDSAVAAAASGPEALFAAARLTGSARLAETLAFVYRNLRWDYEADLADALGDIPARRVAQALRTGFAWQRDAVARVGGNLAEYVTEESGLVTPAREVSAFVSAVDVIRDDVARLDKRIARLAAGN